MEISTTSVDFMKQLAELLMIVEKPLCLDIALFSFSTPTSSVSLFTQTRSSFTGFSGPVRTHTMKLG